MDPDDTLNYSDEYGIRERSNTWPNAQHAFDQTPLHHRHNTSSFSPNSQCSNSRLSLISESNESLNHTAAAAIYCQNSVADDSVTLINIVNTDALQQQQQQNFQQQQRQKPLAAIIAKRSTPTVPNYKAGHPSYVELITTAIMSSPEKRMTLSEIYDWMVANVSAFKDQRHLHSSAGWKNSVRHNLSLHSRFKRVKRNGMDKPSWWTVDLTEQTKDRKHRTPAKPAAGGRARSNTTTAAIFSPPAKIQIVQRQQQEQQQDQSTNSWRSLAAGNSVSIDSPDGAAAAAGGSSPFVSQLTTVADPFVPQVTMINPNDLATVTSSNPMSATLYFKEENGVEFSPTPCSPPRMYSFSSSAGDDNDSAFASNTSLETMEIGVTGADLLTLTSLHKFARAITVTLRDQSGANANSDSKFDVHVSGHQQLSKPEIALQITGDLSGASCKHINYVQQQLSVPTILSRFLRPSSAEESRQMLRVNSSSGAVQDVAVPAPLPIRIVIHTNKECQTDDLETTFEYGLNLHSPSQQQQHQCNPDSPAGNDSNGACVTSSTPCSSRFSSDVANSMMDQSSISPYHHNQQTLTAACAIGGNSSGQNESNQMVAAISASLLPEDLAGLNVEGDMDCNIMDVLRYEMCCNGVCANKNPDPPGGATSAASGAF